MQNSFYITTGLLILVIYACTPSTDQQANKEDTSYPTCNFKAGLSSSKFEVNITDAELREHRPEEHPNTIKQEVIQILEELRNQGDLSCETEHNIESHFIVADAFYADGRLKTAWLTLYNLKNMLKDLLRARSNADNQNPLIQSENDLLSYRDLHNIHVIKENYLTGAQPSLDAYKWLKKKGVTDVITLRTVEEHEKQLIQDLGMEFHFVGWPDKEAPNHEIVEKVQRILNEAKGKVFQHCLRGIGRDMTMSSLIRVASGEHPDSILTQSTKTAPTWEEDQQRTPEGEPVQFHFIKQFSKQLKSHSQ
jgi:protein tyrosine phosphatase (PTP) superfamily phosphohydrolase (DUF442 family)